LPLSFSQERLWFLDQLTPGTPIYNIPVAARFEGELDLEKFRRSIEEVLRRHEILRTRFPSVAGRPVQEIVSATGIEIPVIDLRSMPAVARVPEARRLAAAESMRPFDLVRGPLLRVSLVRLEDRDTVILLTIHHIVFDEWSLGIFMKELGAVYDAYARGIRPSLPEPRLQYADFAAWQRQWIHSDVLETQLAYWRRKLEHVPVLKLPSDYPRPFVATHRGASVAIHIPAAVTAGLRSLAKRRGCTLFMTLLAAFKVLLARYSGQPDFAVGIPIANRNHAATEHLIGFFVNTLVLRTDLSGDPPFTEVLSRVRETTLGGYAHQDLPFVTLVEKLQPERALSHNPLFQVIFQLITASGRGSAWESQLSSVQVQRETAIFDLTMGLEDRGATLDGSLVYSTDLFSAANIARMAGHFVTLLESIVEQPSRRISQLRLMEASEQAEVLAAAAPNRPLDLPAQGIHHLVAERARRQPQAPAILFDGATVTYAELWEAAGRIANGLRKHGVGQDVPVAVAMPRSAAMVTAWLGILTGGGAYVPIDLGWPAARMRTVIADSHARLLLANAEDVRALGDDLGGAALLDPGTVAAAPDAMELGGAFAGPEQLAAILYTSGSTGTPKGIGVPHRAFHRLIAAHFTSIREGDRIAQASNCSFDAASFEIWCALAHGATVCGIPHEVVLSPEELGKCLRRDRITHLFLTTALFNEVARTVPAALESVREVLFGGETADGVSVERVLAAGPPARLVNVYGPTENTTFSTFYEIRNIPNAPRLPIGTPLDGSEVYILGAEMELLPYGVAGELWLSGEGLARGYIGRPAATAEAFVPHPYSRTPGARLYRTGDRARLMPGGAIDFLGRRDTQVKLRGYRIELQEVEAALLRHPDVHMAAAAIADSGAKGQRLLAYVVLREGRKDDAAELRAFLKQTLPGYMLPAEFALLSRMPVGPTGKVDRSALPRLEPATIDAAGEVGDEPRSDTERMLCDLWAGLMDRARVGIYDNFFELGGHSLMATHLIARVRGQLQVEIPLRTLFESPTVVGFAERIDEFRRASARGSGDAAIASAPVQTSPPASFAQSRLWLAQQLAGRTQLFNIPNVFQITGPLRVDALEWALGEIVRRHEPLRTRFWMQDGVLTQAIAPYRAGLASVEVHDLQGTPEPERGGAIQRQLEQEKQRAFDLESDIPIRCAIFRESAGRCVLALTVHHIAFDSVSETILFRELPTLYSAFCRNLPSPLEDLPVQYSQYATWQRERLSGVELDRELRFWQERLKGLPPLDLPFRKNTTAPAFRAGDSAWITLPAETSQRLKRLAQEEGCTLFMVLLAAFQAVVNRLTGQNDVAAGTPAGNRPIEVESLIGFFVNMIVLRGDVSGNPTFRELLARVKEATLDAFQHQEVPFEKVVEALRPERQASDSPLFRAVLALQKSGGVGLRLDGLDVQRLDVHSSESKYDITLIWVDAVEGLRATLEYRTDVMDHESAVRLLQAHSVLLDAASQAPGRRIGKLPVVEGVERKRLIEEFAPSPESVPAGLNIAERFEALARAHPEAVAITGAGGDVTYGELDRMANRVAAALAESGIQPDALVALCLPRSAGLIAAMLGVLKSGAAYLPLDPSDPAARKTHILKNSAVAVLLTQADLIAEFAGANARILLMEKLKETANAWRSAVRILPQSLAYVMYTSGSSGSPKGVAVTHAGVTDLVCGATFVQLGADTCTLQASPCGFDASTFEIWGGLLVGGRVSLMAPGTPSLNEIEKMAAQSGVTTLWMTAALFHQMVESQSGGFAGLRELIAGGDVLSPAHVRRFMEAHPHCRMVNGYGPTEATVFTTCCAVSGIPASEGPVPIGRPVAGARVYVLDENLEPAPIGIAGSLYIGGTRLARGYHRQPGLTAEAWLPDPFAGTPGARMYATGDRARWRPDGQLEFLGRRDRQVKIRGYRVELAEVESTLALHPAVRQAAAFVLPEQRLAAFVTLDQALPTDVKELVAHIRLLAPSFLVPSSITVVDRLPVTPNGKVDYRKLAGIESAARQTERQGVPPAGPLQELITEIWRDVFETETVWAGDHFFDLGGHSLMAMRVVSRLRSALRVEVPLRLLFEAPTVRHLAAALGSLMASGAAASEVPIRRVLRESAWPLSPRQEVVWRTEQSLPQTPLLTIGTAVRLRGPLDREALERTLNEIYARHESLRACFSLEDGRPVQRALDASRLPLDWIDLSGAAPPDRESKASKLATQWLQRGFDLSQEPPCRLRMITLSPEDHVLALAVHHIAADGWSMNLLAREFDRLYRGFRNGNQAGSPPAEIDYLDCCAWERERADTNRAHLAYWTERLQGTFRKAGLPYDHLRPSPVLLETARASFAFSAELTRDAAAFARQDGVTRFIVLLALYQLFLCELSGNPEIRVGVPFANRGRPEYEEVVGLFTNTVILDARIAPGQSFRELVHQVRDAVLGAEAHQSIPFGEVAAALQSGGAEAPLFETMFLYRNTAADVSSVGDLQVAPFRLDQEALRGSPMLSDADLILEMTDGPARIHGSMIYRPDLMDATTMRRWVRRFRRLAADCLARPDAGRNFRSGSEVDRG
jgi:amino acid adenylation domain-containing protein